MIEHGSYGQCVRQISKSLVSHRACQLALECSRFSWPPDRSGPDSTCASVAGPQSCAPYLFRACGRRVVARRRPSKLECITDRRSPQRLGIKSVKRAVDRGWVAAFASYTRPARGTDKYARPGRVLASRPHRHTLGRLAGHRVRWLEETS